MLSDAEIDLEKLHDTITEELNNCNDLIEEFAPEQDKNKLFKIAEESFLTTLKAKKEWESHKEEIKKLEEMVNKFNDEDNMLDLENSDEEVSSLNSHTRTHTTNSHGQKDDQFLTIMDAIKNINSNCVIEDSECKNDESYKEFMKKLHNNQNEISETDENSGIQVTSNTASYIDVLSQQIMEVPVKNIICGHHYEHDHIYKWLENKKHTRCPHVGCNKNITKENLVIDIDFMTEIQNSQKAK